MDVFKLEIEVNPEAISLSPDINDSLIVTDKYIDDMIDQLKQELLYSKNSSYLITGYRGAGKTTFVKRLINLLKKENDKILVVNLNLSKYEDLTMIQRKMIRGLYLSLSKNEDKMFKIIEKKDLVDQIKLLYDHTFFEISTISNLSSVDEKNSSFNADLNVTNSVRQILSLFPVIITSLNLQLDLFVLKHTLFWGSVLWFLISNINITWKTKKKKGSINTEEKNRKSLYDDEIAEYHLKNILSDLYSEGIKTVFVIDELDKIEDITSTAKMVGNIKPLLLSNLSSFILISGQQLYYKLENSYYNDDSLFGSIFSRIVHVPLASDYQLERVFKKIAKDEILVQKDIVQHYISSLILNSNRTLRRYINLILKDTRWIKGKCYIEIDNEINDAYQTEHKIHQVLNQIIDKEKELDQYDDGVRDFLTYQLYVLVKKLKIKRSSSFLLDEILDFEAFSEEYPRYYSFVLTDLFHKLVSELTEIKLLEKKENEKDIKYKWADKVKFSDVVTFSDTRLDLINTYIDVEKFAKELVIALNPKLDKRMSLSSMLKFFESYKIIDYTTISKYHDLIQLRNKIIHGEKLEDQEIDLLNSYNFISLKYLLAQEYCAHVISNYLSKFRYKIAEKRILQMNNSYPFNLLAEHKTDSNIIFEILFLDKYKRKDYIKIINFANILKQYNIITEKKNKLVVLCFLKNGNIHDFENLRQQLLANVELNIMTNIYLFNLSEIDGISNISTIESYLDEALGNKEY